MINLNTTDKDFHILKMDETSAPKITSRKATLQQPVLLDRSGTTNRYTQSILSHFFSMFNQVMANK